MIDCLIGVALVVLIGAAVAFVLKLGEIAVATARILAEDYRDWRFRRRWVKRQRRLWGLR